MKVSGGGSVDSWAPSVTEIQCDPSASGSSFRHQRVPVVSLHRRLHLPGWSQRVPLRLSAGENRQPLPGR